jgi:DNA-binding PadR family transcriptional regulator
VSEKRLTPTSYVILGLVELLKTATPYDLKRGATLGVGHFWSLPHTQVYSEPARLAEGGYLDEERERGGRRRRLYRLTPKGRDALAKWRSESTSELYELRDQGLLKLFFGADPAELAESQLGLHRRQLAAYEGMKSLDSGEEPRGPWLALESGIGHQREYIRFWERLAK